MTYVENSAGVVLMPRRDGTGPEGFGPFTGRGMGSCIARGVVGLGLGLGLGLGCRKGFRRWLGRGTGVFSPASGKSEKELLVEEIKYLRSRLNAIDKKEQD